VDSLTVTCIWVLLSDTGNAPLQAILKIDLESVERNSGVLRRVAL